MFADPTGEREGDACLFRIRSESGTDIRKPLFNLLAEKGWPLVGLEAVSLNLEDVFVRITDSDNKPKPRRKA